MEDFNRIDTNDISIVGQESDQPSLETVDAIDVESVETTEDNGEATVDNPEATDNGVEASGNDPETSDPDASEQGEESNSEAEAETAEGKEEIEAVDSTKTDEPGKEQAETIDQNQELKNLTEGRVESIDDLHEILDHYVQLVEESKQEKEPVFENDRAKKAYEFILSQKGDFSEGLQQYHQILAIDPEHLGDKELQFEAFVLERSDIKDRSTAREIFERRYDKMFGDLYDEDVEKDILLEDEHRVATNKARQTILDAQAKLRSENSEQANNAEKEQDQPGVSEEELQAIKSNVQTTIDDFGGVEIPFGKDGKELVQYALDDNGLKELQDIMIDPNSWFADKIQSFHKPNGQFDFEEYAVFMTHLVNHEKIMDTVYDQAFKNGKLAQLNTAKNVELPKENKVKAEPKEESFTDSWANAMKQRT